MDSLESQMIVSQEPLNRRLYNLEYFNFNRG